MGSTWINKTLSTLLFICLSVSCSKEHSRLETALEFAGNNRQELEKVLQHYMEDKDSLKLKSAIFLIENMPNYFSYEDEVYEPIKAALYHAYINNNDIPKQIETNGKFLNLYKQRKIYDSKIITADYLIENIDIAYRLWKERSWNKSLSFEEFCEYLLPYRISSEPLERWRKPYMDKYGTILDSLYKGSDMVKAAQSLSEYIAQKEKIVFNSDFYPLNPGPIFYYNYKCGSCVDLKDIAIYLLRSVGIPCAGHFYITSPNEGTGGHTWAVIKDTTGLDVLFQTPGKVGRNIEMEFKKGKVYEMRFAPDPDKLDLKADIPDFFLDPFILDISVKYTGCNSFKIKLHETNNRYVFLGVHTDNRTTLIDYAKIINNQAIFTNIEPDLIYQFFFINRGILRPAHYPILLKKDNQYKLFEPQSDTENIFLYRKFPYPQWLFNYVNFMYGATIEASNDSSFYNILFKYQIKDSIKNIITQTIYPTNKKIRYLRFRSPKNRKIDIAEFKVFSKNDPIHSLKNILVSGSAAANLYKNGQLENVIDNNPLTFYMSIDTGAIVKLDLGQEYVLSKIQITPHTDDNFIRIGDVYELFYHNGKNGWITLGVKKAVNESLNYTVPVNALLWLKNKTQGREEQVFYIREGKQIFTGKKDEI